VRSGPALLPSRRDPASRMSSETTAAPSSIRERRQRTRARRRRRSLEPPPQLWAKVLVGVHVALAPLLLAGRLPVGRRHQRGLERDPLVRGGPQRPSAAAAVVSGHGGAPGLGAVTVLQTVPLPIALVQALSPLAADDALHVAAMLGDPAPSWVPLSRDPGRTRLSMLLGLNVICTVLALSLLVERQRPRGFMRAIALACSVVVVVSLGHAALGATTVFGVYQPVVGGRVFGPIINVNHLSAFAALTTLLCLGLGIQEEPGARKSLALFAATMAASPRAPDYVARRRAQPVHRHGHRGAALTPCRRAHGDRAEARPRRPRGRRSVGLGFCSSACARRTGLNDIERLDLLRRSGELALDHWIAGAGRGAFEPAFMYRSTFLARYTHPENILIQYATEFGMPVTALAIALFARGTWSALRTSQTSAAARRGRARHALPARPLRLCARAPRRRRPAAACAGIAWTRAHAARKSAYYVWGIATLAALGVAALVVRLPVDDPLTIARPAPGRLALHRSARRDRTRSRHAPSRRRPADGVARARLRRARLAACGSLAEPQHVPRTRVGRAPPAGGALARPHGSPGPGLDRGARGGPVACWARAPLRSARVLARDADVEHIRRASVDAESLAETLARARACAGVSADFRAALDALLVAEGTDDFGAHARHLTALARTQPSEARAAAEALRAAHPEDPAAIAVWMDILILVDPAAALAAREQPEPARTARAGTWCGWPVKPETAKWWTTSCGSCAGTQPGRAARWRASTPVTDKSWSTSGTPRRASRSSAPPSTSTRAAQERPSCSRSRSGTVASAWLAPHHSTCAAKYGRESPQCRSAEQQVSR
jgi:hypothetical protein